MTSLFPYPVPWLPSISLAQSAPDEGPVLPEEPVRGQVEVVSVVGGDLLPWPDGGPGQDARHRPQDGVAHRVELGRPGLAPGVVTLVAQGGAEVDDRPHGTAHHG